MNIEELELKYGPIPSNLDRKKVQTLLKKMDNKYSLVNDLTQEVTDWLTSENISYTKENIKIKNTNKQDEEIKSLVIKKPDDGNLYIILIDDYTIFNAKNLSKDIASKMHLSLLKNENARVVWCKKFEWENTNKREVIKSLVIHILGKTKNRYFARNTVCEIIENNDLKDFFGKSSFYGHRAASHAVCLKDKKTNEVLQAMSFGHPYYGKDKYGDKCVECIRSATKSFSVVVGGMSKLMKFYLESFKDQFNTILFYVDDAHYHSESMDSVNFKFSHFSGSGVHNVFPETAAVFMRTPILHREIMWFQKLGIIQPVPDVGNSVYLFKNNLNNAE